MVVIPGIKFGTALQQELRDGHRAGKMQGMTPIAARRANLVGSGVQQLTQRPDQSQGRGGVNR